MKYGLGEYSVTFKALGDETRLRIVSMLAAGKTCACKLLEAFNFTQPTLSYHMKQLVDSGLVNAEKDGKWVHYSINAARIAVPLDFLSAAGGQVLWKRKKAESVSLKNI